MPSGKLTDGWIVRWRVRGVTMTGVNGPWSDWQFARVDINKPSVSELSTTGMQGAGLWTLSSVTPRFRARITDSVFLRDSYLGAEVEHDPSVPSQGTGLIWSGTGTTLTDNFNDNPYTTVSVPAGKLTDGWLIRWRVRGVTMTGVNGPWSEWQTARVSVNRPVGTGLGVVPGTKTGDTSWVLASSTPWLYTKVTAADGSGSYLSAEVEHDPSVPSQGTGLVWSGTATTSYASGSNAWIQVPINKLTDGWRVRWRVRGVTTTGVTGPWSDWQSATVSVDKPAVAAAGMTPGTAGVSSWTTAALTPWLFATVTDSQGRSSYLGVEVEHDPSATEQGSGQIWAGTGTTAAPAGSKAWVVVPQGKLSDGWKIRWRVRGVTTSGVGGPWSEWQSARVSALPFQTFSPADNTQVGTLRPILSAHAQSPVEAKVVYWFQVCAGTKDHWTWCESSSEWTKEGTFAVPANKLQWGKTYWWYAKAATSATTVTSSWRTFTTAPQQGTINSLLTAGTEGREFNHVSGSYTRSVTDLSIATPGLPLAVTRTYNSLDPRSDGGFGSGWSTRWDMRIQDEGQAIAYPSMVGHWRLGDVGGSVFAADASGRRYNAALAAGTSLVPGKIGGAVARSGGPVATAPDPVLRTDDSYTVASWLKLDDRTGSYQVAKQNGTARAPYYLGVDQATGQLVFATYASDAAGATRTAALSETNAPVGEWFHVAGVYNKTAGSISLYLNGTLVKTVTGVPAGWNATGTTVLGDIKGAIDDVRMFQSALTAAEIQALATTTTITPPATVLATYPDGSQQRFASKGDGTYASPPGTFATLVSLEDSGWRLMDRSATSYWFDASGRLTKVSDKRGNSQDLVYGTDGRLLKVTATGGRSITFTWTGAHVTSVATDPVDGVPVAWNYEYDGDKLVKACPPAANGSCTTYTYTDASRYRSVVLDSSPAGYWRLGGTATSLNSKVPSSVGVDLGESDGKLMGTTANATAGVAGALAGTPDTAMTFAGTSGSEYVALPEATVSGLGGSLSIEAWFKTTGSGTILGYQSSSDDSPLAYALGIYVGTDGKLRGQLWNGAVAPITSPAKVNDGVWHHVVLSGSTNIQTLFLDGQPVGGLAGKITLASGAEMWDTRIGAGFGSSGWPSTTGSFTTFPFAGSIDEVAVYDKPLGLATVRTHYAARLAQPLLTKETQPSGRVHAENTYAADGGRLKTHTDGDGGTWTLSDLSYSRDSNTQISAAVSVTDADNGKQTYVTDALRGNRAVSATDQLGKTTRYAYDIGGFPAKITDPNGNGTELSYNARGNLIGRKTCRATDACFTEYYSYYLNIDDPFDPRNDKVTAYRDGRSASSTDDTYAVTMTYNSNGEQTKKTVPATPDFPQGRFQVTAFTDGTEPAIGGGTTPAGLVKSDKDFKGNETKYAYTSNGDLAEEIKPAGLVERHNYDAIGRLISDTEISSAIPDGITTTFTYDPQGRPLTVTAPGNKNEVTGVTHTARATYGYDADGSLVSESVTDLTGGDAERKTVYTYNTYGRLETITSPEGGVRHYSWNDRGSQTSMTNELGTQFDYAYTPRGELASETLKGWTGSPISPATATDITLASYAYDPGGRLASEVDAMGRRTSYTYFGDDRLSQVIADDAKLNGQTTTQDVVLEDRTYDGAGNLVRERVSGGLGRTDYVYDAASRLVSQTFDPDGLARKVAYAYDAADNVTRTTLSKEGEARTEIQEFAYNADGLVTRETVDNGSEDLVTNFDVDDRGLVTSITQPRGTAQNANPAEFTFDLRYDMLGQLIEARAPQVKVERNHSVADARPSVRFGYNLAGEQTHIVDGEGNTTTYSFDRAGRLSTVTAPTYTPPGGVALTPRTSYVYDAAGQVTKRTDPRGTSTDFVYDALGNLVRTIDPAPTSGVSPGNWDYGYDLAGELLSLVTPTGARTQATYDDLGRRITQTQIERYPSAAAYTTRFEYDAAGNLLKSINSANQTSTQAVNAAGEVITTTDALGNSAKYSYDLAGRVLKVTDPLGNETVAEYDLAGRQIAALDRDSSGTTLRTRRFGYDLDGNQTSVTSGEGHTTRRLFDATGLVTQLVEPVSATEATTTSFGYDANGARTRVTDGRGNDTWTTYNSLGLVESRIEPATAQHPAPTDRTWTTSYDAAGNPVSDLQPGGVRVDRTFDNLNQVLREAGSGAEASTQDHTYTYDADGRRTQTGDLTFTYNDRDLITSITGGQAATYQYDALGRLTQRDDVNGRATFTWDNADRLASALDPVSGLTFSYEYDKADRPKSITAGSRWTQSFTYDALDRRTSQTLKNASSSDVAKIDYGYDLDDHLTSKVSSGTAGAGTNAYSYDRAGRLTSWTAPTGSTTQYKWDASGNRTQAGDKISTYDERNRLVSGAGTDYTYTARGTLATRTKDGTSGQLTFDAFDRLISDGDISYGYDHLDRMTSHTASGSTQKFLYADLGNDISAIADGAGTVGTRYGRDVSGNPLSSKEGSGQAQALLADLHGDIIGSFQDSGDSLTSSTEFSPFGEVTTRTGAVGALGFQGEWTDPGSGDVNMHARWYLPDSGRFTSADTWILEPDPSIQGNRYNYGDGDPLTTTDPTGHYADNGPSIYRPPPATTINLNNPTNKSSGSNKSTCGTVCKGVAKGLAKRVKPALTALQIYCMSHACTTVKLKNISHPKVETPILPPRERSPLVPVAPRPAHNRPRPTVTYPKGGGGCGASCTVQAPKPKPEPVRAPKVAKKSCTTCFVQPAPARSDDYTHGVCTVMPQDQCGPAVVVDIDRGGGQDNPGRSVGVSDVDSEPEEQSSASPAIFVNPPAGNDGEGCKPYSTYGTDSIGRPSGAYAFFCDEKDTAGGSPAQRDPKYWPGNNPAHPAYPNGKVQLYSRCHVLGNQLGGTGLDRDNLVPCYSHVNNGPMKRFENSIKKAIKAGGKVAYSVSVIYNGMETIPNRFRMTAYHEGGVTADECVHNDMAGTVTDGWTC